MPVAGPPSVASPQARTTVPATGAVSWPRPAAPRGERAGAGRPRQLRPAARAPPRPPSACFAAPAWAASSRPWRRPRAARPPARQRAAQRVGLRGAVGGVPGGFVASSCAVALAGLGGGDLARRARRPGGLRRACAAASFGASASNAVGRAHQPRLFAAQRPASVCRAPRHAAQDQHAAHACLPAAAAPRAGSRRDTARGARSPAAAAPSSRPAASSRASRLTLPARAARPARLPRRAVARFGLPQLRRRRDAFGGQALLLRRRRRRRGRRHPAAPPARRRGPAPPLALLAGMSLAGRRVAAAAGDQRSQSATSARAGYSAARAASPVARSASVPGHFRWLRQAHQCQQGRRDVGQPSVLQRCASAAHQEHAAPGWWCARCAGRRSRGRASARNCRDRRSPAARRPTARPPRRCGRGRHPPFPPP